MVKIQQNIKKDLSSEEFDYKNFEKEAIAGLYAGKELLGSGGVLTGMVQRILNAALSGEVIHQIKEDKLAGINNRRNGHTSKTLNTPVGPVEISPPRDRNGSFEPQLIPKWDRNLGVGLDKHILLMYSNGNSYLEIQYQIKELYGLDYSTGAIAEVTEQVTVEIAKWQQRPLLDFYAVIYLDGIYFTSREDGRSSKKVMYSVYSIDAEGNRDILGIYLRDAESSKEWGLILEDLKKRGVSDVLFFCVDGLSGFSEAIQSVFPLSFVQRCIVHMIRSSLKFVSDKDSKELCRDLKGIYGAADETNARIGLEAFKVKWDKKYPSIAKSWESNWSDLMVFMGYGYEIRRMIYTTNAVEALHRQIRKVTKTKGSWVNDKALVKQIYLTLMLGRRGWQKKVFGWKTISNELDKTFGERYTKHTKE
jgi:putative transposase